MIDGIKKYKYKALKYRASRALYLAQDFKNTTGAFYLERSFMLGNYNQFILFITIMEIVPLFTPI